MTTLADIPLGEPVRLRSVEGARGLRRRLMELGLVPGVEVTVVRVAPLGDPLELRVRGGSLSVRREEAARLGVERVRRAGEGA